MHKRLFSTNFDLYKEFLNENNIKLIIAIGPAGTGKTMAACLEAIKQYKEGNIKKIVITRPIIGADNDIGYLPGAKNYLKVFKYRSKT